MSLTDYFVEGIFTGGVVILLVITILSIFLVPVLMWWELQQNIKDWKASQDEIDEWFEQRKVYWSSKKEKE